MRCRLGFHDVVLIWDPRQVAEPYGAVPAYRYCRRCHETAAPEDVVARWMAWMISQIGPNFYA